MIMKPILGDDHETYFTIVQRNCRDCMHLGG